MCLAYTFDMLSVDQCTTRHWQTSGLLVQELNVFTAHDADLLAWFPDLMESCKHFLVIWKFCLWLLIVPMESGLTSVYLLLFSVRQTAGSLSIIISLYLNDNKLTRISATLHPFARPLFV